MADISKSTEFFVKDCALATIALGVKAQTLGELRDRLDVVPFSSIYFHFWGGRLRTSFEYAEYHNDFSQWVHYALHDNVLAERLDLINPIEHENGETLRAELIETIEKRMNETEIFLWAKSNEQFHFMRSHIIVFSTQYRVNEPRDLVELIPQFTNSIFFLSLDRCC